MMNKQPLTKEILLVITLVQAAKKLFIQESRMLRESDINIENIYTDNLKVSHCWSSRTREYYMNLDGKYLESIGLCKSELCFIAIEDYELTKEISYADINDLERFCFSY